HRSFLSELGATPVLRRDVAGEPTVTDNGNLLLDCAFEQGIADPIEVERRLSLRAGVVDTGLFLGLADTVVVADGDGISVRRREGAA
ncbi:MAG: ribose-5-phosphate isomerase A, partial [Gemmatimonadetes bacterium]|nr:ribose-5-phosphate isomerase A [Gemmatimonadota bacterium]